MIEDAPVPSSEKPGNAMVSAHRATGGRQLDGLVHAQQAKLSFGLSPLTTHLALFDWGQHFLNAPYQALDLLRLALETHTRCAAAMAGLPPTDAPAPDHRFRAPPWEEAPYKAIAQVFLMWESFWSNVVRAPRGVQTVNARIVEFGVRQMLDVVSPSNVPWINPEVRDVTVRRAGLNFAAGAFNYLTDVRETMTGRPATTDFVVGADVAASAGRVVFRNALIEVLQYAATTPDVRPEPILFVPAWIMKFYILDLSPQNSLVRYLVDRGHTVFMISWRNPDARLRDTGFEAYVHEGFLAAVEVVYDICGGEKIHACGYCLGGTLLAIGAAAMARAGDERLASATLFCAQTDFTEAGELQLFTTEDQIAFIEDLMESDGYLDSPRMAGAFQLLRSNDLVWSRLIRRYFLGEREHESDLMAWNADGTRMPARMHSEYLRRLFLENQLAEGHFAVDGRPVALNDIRIPLFVVGTEADHIAPWRSVFKLHLLTDAEMTFLLASGGHNAGVISEPGRAGRHYRCRWRPHDGAYTDPEAWLAQTAVEQGSWWPVWADWLSARSGGPISPPSLGSARFFVRGPAPGTYVHER